MWTTQRGADRYRCNLGSLCMFWFCSAVRWLISFCLKWDFKHEAQWQMFCRKSHAIIAYAPDRSSAFNSCWLINLLFPISLHRTSALLIQSVDRMKRNGLSNDEWANDLCQSRWTSEQRTSSCRLQKSRVLKIILLWTLVEFIRVKRDNMDDDWVAFALGLIHYQSHGIVGL